jgi:hypothetical protein
MKSKIFNRAFQQSSAYGVRADDLRKELSRSENVFGEAKRRANFCRSFRHVEVNGVKRVKILKIKIFEILGVLSLLCKPGNETSQLSHL